MSKLLMESLKLDLPGLAELLRSKGRGKDTVLAHITPKEAALLKKRGGRGSRNPDTGLLEFDDSGDLGGGISYSPQSFNYDSFTGGLSSPADQGTGLTLPQQTVTDKGQYVTDPSASGLGIDTSQGAAQTSIPTPDIQTGSVADVAQNQATQQQVSQDLSGYQGGTTTDTSGSGSSNWLSQLTSALGGAAGLAKLAGLGGVAAAVGSQAQTAAQQGQQAAQQVGAIAPQVQAQSAAAQQQLGNIAQNAQLYGQQAANQVGAVIPQLQQIGQNISAYGQPLIDTGTQQMQQALGGALTPANQQAYNALKAQAEQGIASRGGVGAMQAGVAEQNALANLAQQQFQAGQQAYQAGAAYGVQGQSMMAQAAQLGLTQEQIQLAQNNLANQIQIGSVNTALAQNGIADGYTVQGIQMGLQADQQLAAQMSSLYQSLAQIAFNNPTTPKYSATTGQPLYNTQTGQFVTQ